METQKAAQGVVSAWKRLRDSLRAVELRHRDDCRGWIDDVETEAARAADREMQQCIMELEILIRK